MTNPDPIDPIKISEDRLTQGTFVKHPIDEQPEEPQKDKEENQEDSK